MTKYILDLELRSIERLNEGYVVLRLTDPQGALPEMRPGQFVEVRVDGSPTTFLRRPISINRVVRQTNELWLLVHAIGDGTRRLASLTPGATVNVVLPLGNGFTLPEPVAAGTEPQSSLLVGGGVGTAPLLALGEELVARGHKPAFVLGARSAKDLMQLDLFRQFGPVHVTTEDGSAGERGFVTQHSVWSELVTDNPQPQSQAGPSSDDSALSHARPTVYTCGPKPMMMAVAQQCRELGLYCEASFENMMACGLGACLCCVEATTEGNVCVCKDGPVFAMDGPLPRPIGRNDE